MRTVNGWISALCLAVSLPFAATAQQAPANTQEYAALVQDYATGELQQWITDPVIIYAIREQNGLNQNISKLKIKKLDKQWINGGRYGPMLLELLDRQASVIARDRRELSNGIVNEIIVMDAVGMNVAISDPTSDFFQGDEAKWQQTFLIGPDAVHVGDVEFDESTQKVQTQVSLTVTDPDTGEPIGAVTLGISLDKLTN